jgi:hypothetical protein
MLDSSPRLSSIYSCGRLCLPCLVRHPLIRVSLRDWCRFIFHCLLQWMRAYILCHVVPPVLLRPYLSTGLGLPYTLLKAASLTHTVDKLCITFFIDAITRIRPICHILLYDNHIQSFIVLRLRCDPRSSLLRHLHYSYSSVWLLSFVRSVEIIHILSHTGHTVD